MRITGVEIANYRGFAGDSFRLTLAQGENLLVYGENGAGKSSLYNALKDFLHAATNKNVNIVQNRYRDPAAGDPSICITTALGQTQWTQAARGQDTNDWRTLDDGKGFLDYRQLLRFHNAPKDRQGRMDIFRLLLEGMLAHYRMEVPGQPTFIKEWREIELQVGYRLYENEKEDLKTRVDRFNAAFKIAAEQLGARATRLLRRFDSKLTIAFVFTTNANFDWYPKTLTPPRIVAEPQLPDRASVINYDDFFNEARLSAMAICLFFAALKSCPIEGPRLLVLDDFLIGLDMVNRKLVLKLVERLFRDWQIVILTYHKAWFEILKEQTRVGRWSHPWRNVMLRPEKQAVTNLLVIVPEESGTALETAASCVERRDLKAAAVYARTALEALLHEYCDKWNLPVCYAADHRHLTTDSFLTPIENKLQHLKDLRRMARANSLAAELRLARRLVLNTYAHSSPMTDDEIAGEVGHAIRVVRQFRQFLARLDRDDFDESVNTTDLPIPDQLTVATEMAGDGNIQAALMAVENAAQALIRQRCELKRVKLEFRRHYPHSMLFGVAFPRTDLSPRGEAVLRMVEPYLLGSVTRDHFDTTRFAATMRFIAQINLLDLLPLFASRSTPT